MAKRTKKQMKKVKELDDVIENLELDGMSQTEIERTIKTFSKEGMELRKERKDVRYQLYRLRTEQEGKAKSDSTEKFKKTFESQPFFGGWRFFGVNWDVAFDDPYRIVSRTLSEQEEWNELIRAKFPTISHDGKVSYPDINVRRKIEAQAKIQMKKK